MASQEEIWARLTAFRQHLPDSYEIEERVVQQYHSMVGELETATSLELSGFRVAAEDIRPKVVSVRMPTRRRPGQVNHSEDNYCLRSALLMKIDALIQYIEGQGHGAERESGPLLPSERLSLAIYHHVETAVSGRWLPTTVGDLRNIVGGDVSVLVDGLKELHALGYLGLRKWSDYLRRFVTYTANNTEDDFFYRGTFEVNIEAKGRPYFEGLERRDEKNGTRVMKQVPGAAPGKQPTPLRIFLCHSSGDKEEVRKLYAKLTDEGFAPWLDDESLLPGQDWDLEIRRAVRNSHVVLVCLSRSSITKEGYGQKEITLALNIADEKPEGTIFVIPVCLEECDLPDRIAGWHRVDLFTDRGYEKLVTALRTRESELAFGTPPVLKKNPRPARHERAIAPKTGTLAESMRHALRESGLDAEAKRRRDEKEAALRQAATKAGPAQLEILAALIRSKGDSLNNEKLPRFPEFRYLQASRRLEAGKYAIELNPISTADSYCVRVDVGLHPNAHQIVDEVPEIETREIRIDASITPDGFRWRDREGRECDARSIVDQAVEWLCDLILADIKSH